MDLTDEELKATKEKTADEMFTKDFKLKKIEHENGIEYKQEKFDTSLLFNEKIRTISLHGFNALDMQELKAIYKKCHELGWLDE